MQVHGGPAAAARPGDFEFEQHSVHNRQDAKPYNRADDDEEARGALPTAYVDPGCRARGVPLALRLDRAWVRIIVVLAAGRYWPGPKVAGELTFTPQH
jgi:hypothetical protein